MLVPQSGDKEGRHLKILALVDLSKPLLKGTVVKTAGALKWISFKYERCPDFCYSCGIVGYSERSCKEKRVLGGSILENQYAPWLRAGNNKISSQEKPARTEVSSDKRYWKFQKGELVEQERIRTQLNRSLLETLKSTGQEGNSNQDLMKAMEDMRIVQDMGALTIVVENKEAGQGCSEGPMHLDKGRLDLSLVIQVEEVKQTPTIVEEMGKDKGGDLQAKNQDLGVSEGTAGLVIHHES